MMSIRALQIILLFNVVLTNLTHGYFMKDSGEIDKKDYDLDYLDYMTSEMLPKAGNMPFRK